MKPDYAKCEICSKETYPTMLCICPERQKEGWKDHREKGGACWEGDQFIGSSCTRNCDCSCHLKVPSIKQEEKKCKNCGEKEELHKGFIDPPQNSTFLDHAFVSSPQDSWEEDIRQQFTDSFGAVTVLGISRNKEISDFFIEKIRSLLQKEREKGRTKEQSDADKALIQLCRIIDFNSITITPVIKDTARMYIEAKIQQDGIKYVEYLRNEVKNIRQDTIKEILDMVEEHRVFQGNRSEVKEALSTLLKSK